MNTREVYLLIAVNTGSVCTNIKVGVYISVEDATNASLIPESISSTSLLVHIRHVFIIHLYEGSILNLQAEVVYGIPFYCI